MAKAGRPSIATPEIKAAIVEAIATGRYLTDVCAEPGMPSRRTVLNWQDSDAEFCAQCARAREVSGEVQERAIAQLSRDVLSGAVPADAARVALNAMTWIAKVRAPKVYGDKVEHAGTVGMTVTLPSPLAGV